jgi:hypothetical protein
MGAIDLPKSPNIFHPEKPSAVGSRNSLAQELRNQQEEVDRLLAEEVDKVMNHLTSRLPREVLERLDVMGGIKEKLYNYFNQNYQNMFNRYITTAEDEMVKKVRNFVDKEEAKTLARYTPKQVAELLDQIGGPDKFNTGEIEKSIINMYGHLQGHIQRGVNDLENLTNALLRQKTDVGAFIRGEMAYSIVKCSFKDNIYKPKTVSDVKLSINILDSELISPIFHYQVTVEFLIKEILAKHIMDEIDKEIEKLKDDLLDEGKDELSPGEVMFEKFKRVEKYTDDDRDNPNSNRYKIVGKKLMDKIAGLRAEIDPTEFDQLNIRENLKRIVDIENIRNRGFNTAVNSITSILDTSKMGYQYIENLKNARELIIREYEDTDTSHLPDERYMIRMRYYDNAQLIAERKAYSIQAKAFEIQVKQLWDVLEQVYRDSKFFKRVSDFDDLVKIYQQRVQRANLENGETPEETKEFEDIKRQWDEITFVDAEDTPVEKFNRTYLPEKNKIKRRLILMKEKLQTMYGYRYPIERRVMEDRLNFLEKEFLKFEYMINPYHVQPGLLLDVDITSIKRKKATLDGMANVLNEFLHGVSKGFQDAAFASFSRRRSTVREDISQSFSGSADETSSTASDYLSTINADVEASVPEQTASTPKAGSKSSTNKGNPVSKPTKKGGKRGGGLSEI